MCIYCGTPRYRKIYENHYGPIPKDELNRSYEIHHIDGNHSNNDPSNLRAVSLQEHYDVHYAQGDYWASWKIAAKMKMTGEQISALAKQAAAKQLKEGKHPFQNSEMARTVTNNRIARGEHPFLDPNLNGNRIKAGTFHLLSGKIQSKAKRKEVDEGEHLSDRLVSCLCCGYTCDLGNYKKHHHNKCKGAVKINGEVFATMREASKALKISIPTIQRALEKTVSSRKIHSAEYINRSTLLA